MLFFLSIYRLEGMFEDESVSFGYGDVNCAKALNIYSFRTFHFYFLIFILFIYFFFIFIFFLCVFFVFYVEQRGLLLKNMH